MKHLNHFKKRLVPLMLAALTAATVGGCLGPVERQLTGRTMGTTYHITVVAGRYKDMAPLQAAIEDLLEQINRSMSTFRDDSEISRFNALTPANTPFPISPHFLRVMLAAREVYRLTNGAWDGTVNPLVNLWGFGREAEPKAMPSPEAVARARENVGFDHIKISSNGYLEKDRPQVTLDLASIAKGYAVEQVALLLKQDRYDRFVVEIGGEVQAAGLRPDGKPWKVGINVPRKDAPLDAVYRVVPLRDRAMATSGSYRNFYELGGRQVSHIIDPQSGYPVENSVVSVSVVADSCTFADGLATALEVMGPEKGLALLNQLEGVEGLIVVQQPDGSLKNYASRGMDDLK